MITLVPPLSECGPNFTSKLEGMFKDIELSKEMMTSFKHVSIQFCLFVRMFVRMFIPALICPAALTVKFSSVGKD